MRLINTTSHELETFFSSPPSYAILSHTWVDGQEVTYQDMLLLSSPSSSNQKTATEHVSSRSGYKKIIKTCDLAKSRGLTYAWVDTCCIDKTSSAELTESINSMFAWYRGANVCIAFLPDYVPVCLGKESSIAEDFRRCKWFSRGWTLQELLAPRDMDFYAGEEWNMLGSRSELARAISGVTRIPVDLLLGRWTVDKCSVAMRMSWASSRQTTRLEDWAYSLLGIFGVNMPLIYGEGMQAFRRLQEEITRRNNDLTIFAWDHPHPHPHQNQHQSPPSRKDSEFKDVFAPTPYFFSQSGKIVPFYDVDEEFVVTNKGVRMSGVAPLRLVRVRKLDYPERYALVLGHRLVQESNMTGIFLRKIAPGLYARDGGLGPFGLAPGNETQLAMIETQGFYMTAHPAEKVRHLSTSHRKGALHVPRSDGRCKIVDVVPEKLWDATDRVFLRPNPYAWSRYDMVLALMLDVKLDNQAERVRMVVILDYRQAEEGPCCHALTAKEHPQEEAIVHQQTNKDGWLSWRDLLVRSPGIKNFTSEVRVNNSIGTYVVKFSTTKKIVDGMPSVEVYSFQWDIDATYLGTWRTEGRLDTPPTFAL
ncbi:hypothetical protein MKZ38_007321 [Zalerion maritima]|uniref:Heterokaryon incompatibility domain-containing protein n=1 Tax=Zalerion maritima TaxID=339359 RepID=A0AAD5RMT9_9PEZI|nr:hypothetical protein MKZ38_007321 [Zalerion maritima]